MKDAVTVTSVFRVTLHVDPFPVTDVQPDSHPRKLLPALGAAVRATVLPVGNAAAHVLPQLIPDGALVITPSAALAVTSTERLLVEPEFGHPRLAGPSTVMDTKLLVMSLGLSCIEAKICATPQFVFGETTPGLVN